MRALLPTVSMLLAVPLSAQTKSDDALVESLYPKFLTEEVQDPADLQPSWRYQRADLDGTGTPSYIVALYANGARAVLRIISVTGNSGTVVAAPADPMLDPFHMGMKLMDLDGDGKPEMLLSSGSMRRSMHWIFAWRNHALVMISPARTQPDGTHISLIPDVRVVDVDGDGLPELLTQDTTTGLATTYKLVAGTYQRTADTVFTNEFVRGTGEPNYWDVGQGIEVPTADLKLGYELRVINGAPTGIPARSATITLNGNVIFKPVDFRNAPLILKTPVRLTRTTNWRSRFRGRRTRRSASYWRRHNEAVDRGASCIGRMRTTLTIEDAIVDALRDTARNSGQSFKDVVNGVLRWALATARSPVGY